MLVEKVLGCGLETKLNCYLGVRQIIKTTVVKLVVSQKPNQSL